MKKISYILFCKITFLLFVCLAFISNASCTIWSGTIMSRAHGKIGNIILYRNYKNNVAREKPLTVTPNNSPARVAQRLLFSDSFKILDLAISYVRLGFQFASDARSAYASGMSTTLKGMTEISGSITRIDLHEVVLSTGNCPIPIISATSHADAQHMSVTIDKPVDVLGVDITGTYYLVVYQRGAVGTIDKVCSMKSQAIGSGSTTVISLVLSAEFALGDIEAKVFYVATNQGTGADSVSPTAIESIA
jgi:hypothetical protein